MVIDRWGVMRLASRERQLQVNKSWGIVKVMSESDISRMGCRKGIQKSIGYQRLNSSLRNGYTPPPKSQDSHQKQRFAKRIDTPLLSTPNQTRRDQHLSRDVQQVADPSAI